MLKVVIADDEEKVCQLICHLVDWKAMGFDIVAVVNDGKSALECICEKKPDIVITDIRMPTYDGIELIRRTRNLLPDTYFIIISGYSQFEYAKQAIKYGVENYLLKPLKKKELEATLYKILEKSNDRIRITSEKEELMDRLQISEEKNKKNLVKDLMEKTRIITTDFSIDGLNVEYSCKFQNTSFVGFIIHPYISSAEADQQIYELVLKKINQIIDTRLAPICQEIVSGVNKDEVVCVVNLEAGSLSQVKKQLNKLRIEINNWKEIFENIHVVIGVGSMKSTIQDIYKSLQEAEEAILNRMIMKDKTLITYEEISFENKLEYRMDHEIRNGILSSFERMDPVSFQDKVKELEQMCCTEHKGAGWIFSCYKELIQTIVFGYKNYMPEVEIPELHYFIEKYRRMLDIPELFSWLQEYVESGFEKYLESRKNTNTKPIRQAKKYIADRYNMAVSLEEVSKIIGFNPAYFSTLFKKETGKNFTEYVMEIRVQNAKQMIVKSNMDIGDIAMEVGYNDFKYFSKIFKKITGVNPSDYRKLYG